MNPLSRFVQQSSLPLCKSIARQTLGRGQDAGSEAANQLVGRIHALAKSHSLLARSRWEGAQFRELVEDSVAPYRAERPGRVTVEGPDLTVIPKTAQTLALALHELVTNAAKYGALSRDDGRLRVEWHLSGDRGNRRLVLVWQERGGPPVEGPPTRQGFGSSLIEQAITYELRSEVTLDFAREGLRAVVTLPLALISMERGRRAALSSPKDAHAADEPATLRGSTVLVVEDEYLVGQETAEVLCSASCSVTGPVGTMQEALRVAAAEDLDASILDINLNGEMVRPVAHALNARGIPFAFATGYSDTIRIPPELDEAPRVEKPIERVRFLACLAAAVVSRSA